MITLTDACTVSCPSRQPVCQAAWKARPAARLAMVLLAALFGVASARADIILSIETLTGDAAIEVWRGETVFLRTYLNATAGEQVGGLFYTVEMPSDGWQIQARDYASYGWIHNDGLFDASTPVPAVTVFPVVITDEFFDLTPDTPDFLFATSLDPYGTTMGSGVVETFALIFPDLPLGDYLITFGTQPGALAQAFAGDGTPLPNVLTNTFTVSIVPEPSVGLLAALAFAGLAARRRRRLG